MQYRCYNAPASAGLAAVMRVKTKDLLLKAFRLKYCGGAHGRFAALTALCRYIINKKGKGSRARRRLLFAIVSALRAYGYDYVYVYCFAFVYVFSFA